VPISPAAPVTSATLPSNRFEFTAFKAQASVSKPP
jgi:hypothetical protein